MNQIEALSKVIFNKVANMPIVDHDKQQFVGRRTKQVAFDVQKLKEYRDNLTGQVHIDTTMLGCVADTIIQDLAYRDYHYRYEKQYS